MSGKQNLYIGRAGQMAVMAEFLWRGLNVAFPEVDVGDDVFVVKDETGELWRVQVKTASAGPLSDGYSAQFNISLSQLENPRTPDLVYIFAVRSSSGWEPFVIIDRETLWQEHLTYGVGSVSQGSVVLRFSTQAGKLRCSDRDFLSYRNNWSRWPVIRH
ncbi:MAG: hypothetical protein ACJ76Y_22465 [Thermoanaerobaculia bacterium]